MANAVAIHNQLVRERPELAEALYEPMPYDTRGEQADGAQAFYAVPGFTEHGGRLFVRFIPQYILASQRHADAPRLSETAREAIATVSAMANDPDFNVYMDLQPGEMQFINNYHVLHGRTAYEDDVAAGYKRHLKRLWLATYALTDRPAYFQALGRSHWEAKRSVSRLPTVERVSGGALDPRRFLVLWAPGEEAPTGAHGHRGVDEIRGQRTLAQHAYRRHRRVHHRRRLALTAPAVDDARHVRGDKRVRDLVRLGQPERHGAPGAVVAAELAQRAAVGHADGDGPGARVRLHVVGAGRRPVRGKKTSTGPGQHRSSSRPSSSFQAEVRVRTSSRWPTA